jgi:hypothetical protein
MTLFGAFADLSNFVLQVFGGLSSPLLAIFSYYPEKKVLEVIGAGFLHDILQMLDVFC